MIDREMQGAGGSHCLLLSDIYIYILNEIEINLILRYRNVPFIKIRQNFTKNS
jgi:hypothetical protein